MRVTRARNALLLLYPRTVNFPTRKRCLETVQDPDVTSDVLHTNKRSLESGVGKQATKNRSDDIKHVLPTESTKSLEAVRQARPPTLEKNGYAYRALGNENLINLLVARDQKIDVYRAKLQAAVDLLQGP